VVPPRANGLVHDTGNYRQSKCAEENHQNHQCRLHEDGLASKNTLVGQSSSAITYYYNTFSYPSTECGILSESNPFAFHEALALFSF
jgi:hypothetical protein